MWQKIVILFLLQFSFLAGSGHAQVFLNGKYQGRNLYVQNPLNADRSGFCTQKVFVNDLLILSSPKASAFEVDLSSLTIGEAVVIRIEHTLGCEPKFINPQVVRPGGGFRFSRTLIDENSVQWVTEGEQNGGRFFIEQYVFDNWVTRQTVNGKGQSAVNMYSATPSHFAGENKYRLKYLQPDGTIYYSKEISYQSQLAPVSFYPEQVTDRIMLSRETDYQVMDTKGRQILSGRGEEIILPDLKTGTYFLFVENRKEKFFKK